MNDPTEPSHIHWPHFMAVVTACATFPLIWVGGLVTTYDAGMAVPDWPTTYGYNMFAYPWQTWLLGPFDLFIEHGHRLLGSLVGVLATGVVIAAWRRESRGWVFVWSLLCLFGVMAQGFLGGLRVRLDSIQVAKIHGCTGPLFFAACVGLAVVTSRWWRTATDISITCNAGTAITRPRGNTPSRAIGRIGSSAWLVTLLAYAQLILGANLRHASPAMMPSQFQVFVVFHVGLAVLLSVMILWLAASVLRQVPDQRTQRVSWLLSLFVLAQFALGAGTWVVKHGWPAFFSEYAFAAGYTVQAESMLQANVVTAHVALGSLVLAASLSLALRLSRASYLLREKKTDVPSILWTTGVAL